jgi:hypothetical protein
MPEQRTLANCPPSRHGLRPRQLRRTPSADEKVSLAYFAVLLVLGQMLARYLRCLESTCILLMAQSMLSLKAKAASVYGRCKGDDQDSSFALIAAAKDRDQFAKFRQLTARVVELTGNQRACFGLNLRKRSHRERRR